MAGDVDYNLDRFIDAQNGVYEQALSELKAGRKTSHWMWFIFPQIRKPRHVGDGRKICDPLGRGN